MCNCNKLHLPFLRLSFLIFPTFFFVYVFFYKYMLTYICQTTEEKTIHHRITIYKCTKTSWHQTIDHNTNRLKISLSVRECTFGHVHPRKTQTSLCICAVCSESSMGALWIAKYVSFLQTEKTANTFLVPLQMRRLK